MKRDVIVVGGGPAGASVARELNRRGVNVAIVDKARFPRPKPCGEGLMPYGVKALPADFAGVLFKGLRFVSPSGNALKVDFTDGRGMIVSRPSFDEFLLQHSGVEVFEGTLYDSARFPSRWVIAADGTHSSFHKFSTTNNGRFALTANTEGIENLGKHVEIFFHDYGETYLAPTGHIASLYWKAPDAPSKEGRILKTLNAIPALADRIRNARIVSEVLGASALGLSVPQVAYGNVILAGAAAGSPDPITGEGMALAISLAPVLAEAIVRNDIGIYLREHKARLDKARRLARLLLRISKWHLADRAFSRAKPELVRRLLKGDVRFFDSVNALL